MVASAVFLLDFLTRLLNETLKAFSVDGIVVGSHEKVVFNFIDFCLVSYEVVRLVRGWTKVKIFRQIFYGFAGQIRRRFLRFGLIHEVSHDILAIKGEEMVLLG